MGGIYFFDKDLFFSFVDVGHKFSFEKDILEKHAGVLRFSGKVFAGYFIDIGIPEDYNKVCILTLSELKIGLDPLPG